MRIDETNYPFLLDDLKEDFGYKEGIRIFKESNRLFIKYNKEADFRNNKEIKQHMQMNIFPVIAYYNALLHYNCEKEVAVGYVLDETKKHAEIKKTENSKLVKMPFAYKLFKMGAKSHMSKNFPKEGFDVEWVKCDNNEISFNMNRCIYKDLCDQFECPELCTVFCQNDPVAFSGYLPKIKFERSQTLGEGGKCCDFHFINTKNNKL